MKTTRPEALPENAPDGGNTSDDTPDLRLRRLLLPLSARDASAAEEAPAPYLALADDIRRRSADGNVADIGQLRETWDAPDDDAFDALLERINADTACADIVFITHHDTRYYYSARHMSHNYACILVFTHEQDACATLAETVRFECQTYPRPYQVRMLTLPPYRFDEDKIESALRFLAQSDAYCDIHRVQASNGEPYLFSDRFMSYGKAQGLCEWIEVEQYENP